MDHRPIGSNAGTLERNPLTRSLAREIPPDSRKGLNFVLASSISLRNLLDAFIGVAVATGSMDEAEHRICFRNQENDIDMVSFSKAMMV